MDRCWQSNISAFNMLSSFVIAFLSWLQSQSAVILDPKKINLISYRFCFLNCMLVSWEFALLLLGVGDMCEYFHISRTEGKSIDNKLPSKANIFLFYCIIFTSKYNYWYCTNNGTSVSFFTMKKKTIQAFFSEKTTKSFYRMFQTWCHGQGGLPRQLSHKESANVTDVRDAGSVPGSGRSPGGGHDNALQYSFLENHMDRGTC